MTVSAAWLGTTLVASAAMMLLVLAIRAPTRRWVGPRLAYALWALPTLQMLLSLLPAEVFDGLPIAGAAATGLSVLFTGPSGTLASFDKPRASLIGEALPLLWLAGAIGLLAIYAVRHFVFCRRLRANSTEYSRIGTIRVIASDVDGPLAFGVFNRFIAVPREFARDYQPRERDLALAHECAHHARGDLIANWMSLVVLAVHWWNPVAWIAIRAFRQDQEFAVDAQVLAGRGPSAVVLYAHVLAKAAGIGASPACSLNARSNLKGRLMMLGQKPRSSRWLAFGGFALTLLGSAAIGATITTPGASGTGPQTVTIGVKPDGSGAYTLIVGDTAIAASERLPGGVALPADFTGSGGCDVKPTAKPFAMVIKGMGGTQTYTVMCASAAPAPIRVTLAEGLASLNTMRASVATQRQPSFPEAERVHALGAIHHSIREVEATLAAID